ncbi:MAG: hypothetical protein ACJ788_21035 [Ktedonobacteraceae bacterium]
MEDHRQVSTGTTLPPEVSQQSRPGFLAAIRLHHLTQSVVKALNKDWHTSKYTLYATLLVLLTILVVVMYYLNRPVGLDGDIGTYLSVAHQIQTQGHFVDDHRVPGFPLLMVLVFAFAGQDNLAAVTLVNVVLFLLATLEIYLLTALVFKRGWVALLVGLLVGMNILLLSYVEPASPESLALWLLVSLALAATLFVYKPRARYLWLVTGFTLALFFTRPEWIYVPVPLFAYLLLVAARRRIARRMLTHALASVLLLYTFLGCYIYTNATQNDFVGVTDTTNINAWSKVIQYGMQDEAPPEYAAIRRIADTYLAQGVTDPRDILDHEHSLSRHNYALAGAYAQAIIERHPVEFLAKSIPFALSSLSYIWLDDPVAPAGLFGPLLVWLQSMLIGLYTWNQLFPLCAAVWLLLLCWRRTGGLLAVQAMVVVVLLVLYGVILTTVGGFEDYMRLHLPFSPLLSLVVWGSLLTGLRLALLVIRHGPGAIWITLDEVKNSKGDSQPVVPYRPAVIRREHRGWTRIRVK